MATHLDQLAGELRGKRYAAEFVPEHGGSGTRGYDGHAVYPHWRVTWDGVTRVMEDLPDDDQEFAVREHIESWLATELDAGRWHPEP